MMQWSSLNALLVAHGLLAATAHATSVFTQASNDSLQWGPYRPNVYFGLKPRIPDSLTTGLMWARTEDYNLDQNNVRYTCEQNEGMAGYGWDMYDPRTGGVQTIHDRENGLDIETSFVKFDQGKGGWAARIKGTPRADAVPKMGSYADVQDNLKTTVWFTVNLDGLGDIELDDVGAGEQLGFDQDVVFNGQTPDLGNFKLSIVEDSDRVKHPVDPHPAHQTKPLDRTFVHSLTIHPQVAWQAKAILFSSMKATVDAYVEEFTQEHMPSPWLTYSIQNSPGSGNVHLVQKTFEGPFEFDVFYTSSTNDKERTSADVDKALKEITKGFDQKYAESLQPKAPFTSSEYSSLGKALFSNLIGGLGYFYGDQLIDRSYATEYEEEDEGFWEQTAEARSRKAEQLEGPFELFTAVPSRPFFPRGFLWDEGFHLLPILEWDADVVMQIISSWFNTMDEDGWIAREQILGPEARSKVPPEFQVQYPHYANPPTLFLAIHALLDKADVNSIDVDTGALRSWLQDLYPLLQRNFNWYRKTQTGDLKSYDRSAFSSKEAYRWRGRTPQHILPSGLDDYPRAQPPHPGELHTDLLAWMGLMSRAIQRIATYLGETADAAKYGKIYDAVVRNMDDLHWSESHKTYCDATIDDYEESVHVCHKGYVSIFPFMTGLLGPDHPHLKNVLDLIADESELWSPHGIRSLSKRDALYETEENYWRSPVWMNMNFLVLDNLHKIANLRGPHQKQARTMYGTLRKNLVDTVYKSWKDTGFAWEQYNPQTGEGQRTKSFTGWTSVISLVMAMGESDQGHDEL